MRSETLTMVPVFEHLASTVCHCALNQLAQQHAYETFRSDQSITKGFIEGSACRDLATPSSMTREQAEAMRLK